MLIERTLRPLTHERCGRALAYLAGRQLRGGLPPTFYGTCPGMAGMTWRTEPLTQALALGILRLAATLPPEA